MGNEETLSQLGSRFEECGFKWSMVSIQHVGELTGEILQRHEDGLIPGEVYREFLNNFDTAVPGNFPGGGSIIIVASPQPQYRVGFTRYGKKHHFIIPPTYLHHTDDEVEQVLKDVLEPAGYRFSLARLPEKLLSARSGLARYGRNNITYIDGFGSFHRFRTYYTDLPCIEDCWQEADEMNTCQNCHVCVNSCPTGALNGDQFWVQSDKCLTFLNETTVPWPQWVEESWDTDSKCIVGCMKCQVNCPGNRLQKDRVEPAYVFSEQETRELLENNTHEALSAPTLEKLETLYLTEYIPTLSRNLGILFRSEAV